MLLNDEQLRIVHHTSTSTTKHEPFSVKRIVTAVKEIVFTSQDYSKTNDQMFMKCYRLFGTNRLDSASNPVLDPGIFLKRILSLQYWQL